MFQSTNKSSPLTPANGLAGGEGSFTGNRGEVDNAPTSPRCGSITIHLRLPSKDTHPNKQVHWARKKDAVKIDRQYAGFMTGLAMGSGKFGWKSATVHAEWTFKTAARRDRDNLLSWCKHFFDGFQDAGLILNDNGLTHLPHEVTKGPVEGVVFTITCER